VLILFSSLWMLSSKTFSNKVLTLLFFQVSILCSPYFYIYIFVLLTDKTSKGGQPGSNNLAADARVNSSLP
jgi:hypothetical protein